MFLRLTRSIGFHMVTSSLVLPAFGLTFESGVMLNFDENLESDFVFHQQVDTKRRSVS